MPSITILSLRTQNQYYLIELANNWPIPRCLKIFLHVNVVENVVIDHKQKLMKNLHIKIIHLSFPRCIVTLQVVLLPQDN